MINQFNKNWQHNEMVIDLWLFSLHLIMVIKAFGAKKNSCYFVLNICGVKWQLLVQIYKICICSVIFHLQDLAKLNIYSHINNNAKAKEEMKGWKLEKKKQRECQFCPKFIQLNLHP